MSIELDKAIMNLSLDEEDEPFEMFDLPQFKSCERNSRSLVGRILNPATQKISSLIYDLPRIWQKEGRVRGIALSQERFQFIFDKEYDLEDMLSKGALTYNDWSIVVERWVEFPPPDYLQFIPLWVQIKNVLINYYTEQALTLLGELIGPVKEVVFDPNAIQSRPYVRVKVMFDVSKPLRKSKVIHLKSGEKVELTFHYERIRKRCYICQRLNHSRDECLLVLRNQNSGTGSIPQPGTVPSAPGQQILQKDDPLFGVLKEDQVQVDKQTGRPKIAEEVLEEMRRCLLMANTEDRPIRIERVRSSVAEAEKDPLTQKTMLRMEPLPKFTRNVDKGKGVVFDFDLNASLPPKESPPPPTEKLLSSSLRAAEPLSTQDRIAFTKSLSDSHMQSKSIFDRLGVASDMFDTVMLHEKDRKVMSLISPSSSKGSIAGNDSTAHGSGHQAAGPSGVPKKSVCFRRRPHVSKRKHQFQLTGNILHDLYGDGMGSGLDGHKRKANEEAQDTSKTAKRTKPRVVPQKGLPKH